MTIILTVGRESLLLKKGSAQGLAEFFKDARSVKKDYSGKWDFQATMFEPMVELTVLPYDLEPLPKEDDIPAEVA